jgi:NAD(P)-dependent dehydrogenase (short-subunit alcohol dehydrogenase family)
MSRLAGKVALITGAASNPGLGFATACRFAREGAKLVITDIDESGLKACEEEVRKLGGEVVSWRQDVTSEAEWQQTIERSVSTFGKLDILVNNAGIAILRSMSDMTLAEFDKQMQVNMTSVFLGTKYAIPALQASGGGSIVNMSSIAGLVGIPGVAAYSASKAGVRLFTKSVALEWAKEKIRCNSVHPGVIWTNIQKDAIRDNPEQYDIINASIPMGFMGEAEDIANCVLFLASDEAKYITGAEFVVDGGLTAQ